MKNGAFIIYLIIGLLPVACCSKADCDDNGGGVYIRYVRDGKSIIEGPDALLQREDIKVFELFNDGSTFEHSNTVYFDSLGNMSFFVDASRSKLVEIGELQTDTFKAITLLEPAGECCMSVTLQQILRNGQVICEGEACEEFIEIEI